MTTPRRSRRKWWLAAILLIILSGIGLYVWWKWPDSVITVQTEKVIRRNLTEIVLANGRLQPVYYVKISPEVSGEIIELPVKEGEAVQKGDLLFRLKPDNYLASSNVAVASYRSSLAQNELARANLAKAEAEFKRIADLFESKLVSDSQFLDAKTAFEVARASFQSSTHQTENARAALDNATENLAKTTVYSPLTGTISKLNSQLGERVVGTATYQGTEVMTIADLNAMEARVDVGEVDVVLIAVGQKARLEVDAFRDRKFTGIVSDIANTAKSFGQGSQQEAIKFEVRVRLQEKEAFRPGMSVTAEIETRTRTNTLAVPIQSLTARLPKSDASTNAVPSTNSLAAAPAAPDGTNPAPAAASPTNASPASTHAASDRKPGDPPKAVEVVFIATNGVARMVAVLRGISDDSHVEILSGLAESQEVISGGYAAISRLLEEGKRIRVDNTRPAPAREPATESP
ncbi:MAG TPA: efflux RND transporter periplasmic adaptor subunit [Candidatus Paceibacterota bacterium]|nr:efflux RND transporter periplasmic adaptor subunit [Verrucomicrobiota bacterium]HOX01016.1 efflux RND transporter periplasmic adaptor subunit [Verrucomicrobiota bacterium]HRZ43880.1 efflux RND transporter periplasmic adaptor subunit [Candidatus Paceibacterota bacterium]HRZ93181.1 efflux RND transporter periplasmic adaptor subunit [Candidatus Paceibacterota bacterium]